MNQRPGFGGRSGKIILLGDGSEVVTESDETEMFDHEEEDKDLPSQVEKGQMKSESRGDREETPGPEESTEKQRIQQEPSNSPSSTSTEKPEILERKVIPESALPDKIVPPPKIQESK